jgi:hypothetical protein
MSRHENAGQYQNVNASNETFEIVATFYKLGTTYQNDCIHEETKSKLNSKNACYRPVENHCLPASPQKTQRLNCTER